MSPKKTGDRAGVPSLHPTRYDRVASLLISVLVLSSTSVAVLFVIWMGTYSITPPHVIDVGQGHLRGESDGTSAEEFDTPKLAELSDPQLLESTVELSTLLSSETVAAATTLNADVLPVGKDTRTVGASPKELVPRWQRWEIRYESATLQSYAKQLDFFGIELGAAGGGKKQVDYVSKVASSSPATRSAAGTDETRLYMTWRGGRLEMLDRRLMKKAGIEVNGRIAMQFYPQKIEDMLALLESKHRKDGRIDKVKKTIFGVRPAGEGYEFYIIEQT